MPASNPLAATATLNDFSTGKLPLEVLDQHLVLADDQHLGHRLVFEVAQGHAVLFEELDQILARNAAVLRSGDSVALQATGIEPLADRARGHFTDLGDLSSCEDLHRRLSNYSHLDWTATRGPGDPLGHAQCVRP